MARNKKVRHCGAWLEPQDIQALKDIAEWLGTDLTGLFRMLARGTLQVMPANFLNNNKSNKKGNEGE